MLINSLNYYNHNIYFNCYAEIQDNERNFNGPLDLSGSYNQHLSYLYGQSCRLTTIFK